MHNVDSEMRASVIKGILAWTAALLTDSVSFLWHVFSNVHWDKFAQFAAFIYSICLIYEYLAKQRRALKEDTKNGTE